MFYLGHSLKGSSDVTLPSLVSEVQAGDVATVVPTNNSSVKIVTSSNDGRTINVWSTRTTNNSITFVGSYSASERKQTGRTP